MHNTHIISPYELNGWVENSTALNISNSVYPKFKPKSLDLTLSGHVLRDLLELESSTELTTAHFHLNFGNYAFMNMLVNNTKIFLFIDIAISSIWSIILLFSRQNEVGLRVKVVLVLLLQIVPLYLQSFINDSSMVEIMPLIITRL